MTKSSKIFPKNELTFRNKFPNLYLPTGEIARENGSRAKVAKGQNLKGTAWSGRKG